jgi:hypothetical protein
VTLVCACEPNCALTLLVPIAITAQVADSFEGTARSGARRAFRRSTRPRRSSADGAAALSLRPVAHREAPGVGTDSRTAAV